MAAPITKKEIQQLPLHAYEAMRDDLHTGDLVFCSGSYLFSHAIQKFTRSVWSHVGMIYRDPTLHRVFIPAITNAPWLDGFDLSLQEHYWRKNLEVICKSIWSTDSVANMGWVIMRNRETAQNLFAANYEGYPGRYERLPLIKTFTFSTNSFCAAASNCQPS